MWSTKCIGIVLCGGSTCFQTDTGPLRSVSARDPILGHTYFRDRLPTKPILIMMRSIDDLLHQNRNAYGLYGKNSTNAKRKCHVASSKLSVLYTDSQPTHRYIRYAESIVMHAIFASYENIHSWYLDDGNK